MPLQNRVSPFSHIEFSPARGLFTGNRGILHDHNRQLTAVRWRSKAWILCELQYKGIRRNLMQPGSWTELFFLDEATAFAAGHRPCALCRRSAYSHFLTLSGCRSARDLDSILHQERLSPQPSVPIDSLPDGSFFEWKDSPILKHNSLLLPWSHHGYGDAISLPGNKPVRPLTPPLTRRILALGYHPVLHPSALIR